MLSTNLQTPPWRYESCSLCGFLCFNFRNPKLGIRHAMVCGCINTYFGRGAKQIKTTVHILSTNGFYYGRVLHGSVYNDNPANKPTTVNRPKNGVANRLIKQVGSYKIHPHHLSRIDQPEPITPPKTVRLTKPVSGLQTRPFFMLMPKCDGHFRLSTSLCNNDWRGLQQRLRIHVTEILTFQWYW